MTGLFICKPGAQKLVVYSRLKRLIINIKKLRNPGVVRENFAILMANCPICFEDIKEKASPDSCDHVFCLTCLEKWSKLGSFCPVDRKRYKKIVNLESESSIRVKSRKRKKSRAVYDFSAKCENCGDDRDPGFLLLCDCCDLAFHTYCLSPPLEEIPAGLWFCPPCTSVERKLKEKNGITKEVEVDMGNSNLLLEKGGRHGKKTKEKLAEVKEDPASTLDELKTDKFTKDKKCNSSGEACNETVVELEGINSRRYENGEFLNNYDNSVDTDEKMGKSFRFEPQSLKNKNIKGSKIHDIEIDKENLGHKIEMEYKNTKYKNDNDLCLKQSDEVTLIDDCLSQDAAIGYLKFDSFEMSHSEEKYLNQVSHTKNGTLPSCSGVSDESIKGIFKTLVPNKNVNPNLKETDFVKIAPKDKNDLTKEKIFSVFDRIQEAGASQNEYFDINAESCASLSSNLNSAHCFSCQDEIIAASQSYCRICKILKYSISCATTVKDKTYPNSLKYSQAFEYSCDIKKMIENKKINSQKNLGKNKKKVIERRTRSLIRKLIKISESQKKLGTR